MILKMCKIKHKHLKQTEGSLCVEFPPKGKPNRAVLGPFVRFLKRESSLPNAVFGAGPSHNTNLASPPTEWVGQTRNRT